MKIKALLLENFGSFVGQHVFRFDVKGLTLILGDNKDEPRMDSNGSGKSTIFDGLDWCLFDKSGKRGLVDDLISDQLADSKKAVCRARVLLSNDKDEEIIVERKRVGTTKEVILLISGIPFGGKSAPLDASQTQIAIENTLGLDRETFHAAVLFGQQDLVRYVDNTDAGRMKILTNILHLNYIDDLAVKTKENAKALDNQINKLEIDKARIKGMVDSFDVTQLDQQIETWDVNLQNELEGIKQLERTHTEALEKFNLTEVLSLKQTYVNQIAEITQSRDSLTLPANSNIEQAQNTLTQIYNQISIIEAKQIEIKQKINDYSTLGVGVCSKCGQEITQEHLDKEIKSLTTQLEALTPQFTQLITLRDQWVNYKDQESKVLSDAQIEYKTKLDAYNTQIKEVEIKLKDAEDSIAKAQLIQQEIAGLEKLTQEKKQEQNPYKAVKADMVAKKDQGLKDLENTEYDYLIAEGQRKHYEFWLKAFSPTGLKSYILDSKLQELSDATNYWLSRLTGGTMWVRFESQKTNKNSTLRNSPNIRVFRWNPDGTITERAYERWSGGEKKRISFAVDFGLSRLIANRATQQYNILILDEIFKYLDQSGKEAALDILIELASKEKESLFVIEHDNVFQGAFENKIIVQKKNGKSQIMEYTHESGQGSTEVKSNTTNTTKIPGQLTQQIDTVQGKSVRKKRRPRKQSTAIKAPSSSLH